MPGPQAAYIYNIWCETDGGCSNPVVARYNHLIQFELLSPNRPAVKDVFTPKVASLPSSKCSLTGLGPEREKFLRGKDKETPTTPTTPLKGLCGKCRKGSNCFSGLCVQRKCVKSKKRSDLSRCGIGGYRGNNGGRCTKAEGLQRCVNSCVSAWGG